MTENWKQQFGLCLLSGSICAIASIVVRAKFFSARPKRLNWRPQSEPYYS